jgi:hypothetical protein
MSDITTPEINQTKTIMMPGALPGKGLPSVIAVDTSEGARHADGLGMPEPVYGAPRRQFRRAPAYGGYAPQQSAPVGNMVPGRSETTESGEVIKLNASAPVLVKKLG